MRIRGMLPTRLSSRQAGAPAASLVSLPGIHCWPATSCGAALWRARMSRWRLREHVRRAVAGEPLGSLSREPVPVVMPVYRPPESTDIDVVVLRHALSRGVRAQCLDLRPVEELRYGVVRGAWLLDAERLRRLAPFFADGPHVVLGSVEGLTDLLPPRGPLAGRTRGGLGAWRSAGYAISAPEWKAPLPLLHPVRLDPDAIRAGALHGMGVDEVELTGMVPPVAPLGTIQDVHWRRGEFVFDVLFELPGGRPLWVAGLTQEQLQTEGPVDPVGLREQM